MRHILHAFIFFSLVFCSGCANESPMRKYGFREFPSVKPVAASYYRLTFLRSETDKNHGGMGIFSFRHTLAKPLQMSGFGFNPDGSFRVRFERFAKLQDNQWQEVMVGYCGTGAKDYAIEPNKDYIFRVPLWPFVTSGTRGVVLLSGQNQTIMSDEFDGEVVRKNTDKSEPSK